MAPQDQRNDRTKISLWFANEIKKEKKQCDKILYHSWLSVELLLHQQSQYIRRFEAFVNAQKTNRIDSRGLNGIENEGLIFAMTMSTAIVHTSVFDLF